MLGVSHKGKNGKGVKKAGARKNDSGREREETGKAITERRNDRIFGGGWERGRDKTKTMFSVRVHH